MATQRLSLEAKLAVGVCVVLGVYGAALLVTTFFHDGLIGRELNAPGVDWVVYYEAARAVLNGNAALIYDPDRFSVHVDSIYAGWFYKPLLFHPWVYPPQYLLFILPFAVLPFLLSFALFEAATMTALAAALWRRSTANTPRLLALLASPAAFMTLIVGQNSFLSAALLIGSFRLLDRRPILAGALLGMLSYKPQLCLMVPVALVAGGRWRTIAAAVTSCLVLWLCIFALAPETVGFWFDFVLKTAPSEEFYQKWLPNLLFGFSPYIIALVLHAPTAIAAGVQLATAGLATIVVAWAFRRPIPDDIRIAILLAATMLSAPHVQCYDLFLLAAAVVLLFGHRVSRGFRPGELGVFFLAWSLPLFLPIGSWIGVCAPLIVCALLAYATWDGWRFAWPSPVEPLRT